MVENLRKASDGFDWFQRKRKGIQAGDVFSVPLPNGGYAFGRVLNTHDGATIAEFFQHKSESDSFQPDILKAGRAFSPIGILLTDIQSGNRKRPWKVIGRDPNFYPNDLYDLPFAIGDPPDGMHVYTLEDLHKMVRRVSWNEVQNWDVGVRMPQHPDRISMKLEQKILAAI